MPACTIRIIPANTGKMPTTPATFVVAWDHPREYGENVLADALRELRHGIIPANTGKITRLAALLIQGGDHPREYGENHASRLICLYRVGSSPRIRGKWCARHGGWGRGRIIPANTGKILRGRCCDVPCRDHPREYGENALANFATGRPAGSSPRIRGKSPGRLWPNAALRIIPANTGKILAELGKSDQQD